MKKLALILIALIFLCSLVSCSLEYYDTVETDSFSYALARDKAFVYEYKWDGSEDAMNITIPNYYNELKIVTIGGYYGRGYPMGFTVDISDFISADIGEDYEEVRSAASTSDNPDVEEPEQEYNREVVLNFNIIYDKDIELLNVFDQDMYYYSNAEGIITLYTINYNFITKDSNQKIPDNVIVVNEISTAE